MDKEPTHAHPAAEVASPETEVPGAEEGEPPYAPPRYAWYVVGVLILVYIFSFADRQLLNYLVDDIKEGLNLTEDRDVAILMGPAFAIFYAIFGFPLGWLADRMSRRWLVAMGLTVWSFMAAGCGIAKNFISFMGFRIGVGVGEASLSPSAYSIITDYFPKNKIATAISVYGTGIYIGSGMSALVGGAAIALLKKGDAWEVPVFGTVDPWQQVFVLVGLLGLLAVPLLFTIREPLRRGVRRSASGKTATIPQSLVFAYMRKNWKTLACHNVGFALLSFSSYGSSAWIPTFFIRNHGWSQPQIATYYGLIIMICGTAGIATGGWLADKLAKRGYRDSKMRLGLIAAIVWAPFGMLYPFVPNAYVSIALLVPAVFTASMPFGVAPAAIQEIMPNQMRGQASALYLFIVNIIGLAVGPYLLAYMSDKVFGQENLHQSLFWVATTAHVLSALLLWRGLKPFVRSLGYVKEWTQSKA